MSAKGHESRGAGKQMRKGTHSCVECKCISLELRLYLTTNRSTKKGALYFPIGYFICLRGVACRDQSQQDLDNANLENRPNLRERVAKLENILSSIVSEIPSRRGPQTPESDRISPALPDIPDSAEISRGAPENAPLISLIEKTIASSKIRRSINR
jgi:hypothetical protein